MKLLPFLFFFSPLCGESTWKRMLPHTKLSSEDVADCHGSLEPLDSLPQKKCSITSFVKGHAFILLTVLGIGMGECFQEAFWKISTFN